jgi:predicted nucleic acid-binding protein
VTLVVDSSVVAAAFISSGPQRDWAADVLSSNELAAPHLMLVEAANILRRAAFLGHISREWADYAHEQIVRLDVERYPYEPFAVRVWSLYENLTPYDAWYVALAEALGAPLATLDIRLTRSPSPRCAFLTPP